MILDTSFLMDVIQENGNAGQKIEELENSGESLLLSSATVFELYTGIKQSDKPEEEKKEVLRAIGSKPVIDADLEIMKKAGKIHGEKIVEGDSVKSFDCIIGATAITRSETVVTRDRSDFERIEGVELETY